MSMKKALKIALDNTECIKEASQLAQKGKFEEAYRAQLKVSMNQRKIIKILYRLLEGT